VPSAKFLEMDMIAISLPDTGFEAVVSYYSIIHVPRAHHAGILASFHRLLRPGGWSLLCLGANDLPEDIGEIAGIKMFWSHFDAVTSEKLVRDAGFRVEWSRRIPDPMGGDHLFVLAQK
jgi:ubiquinone/menaquinone biosynthesis C-methylase UbiE